MIILWLVAVSLMHRFLGFDSAALFLLGIISYKVGRITTYRQTVRVSEFDKQQEK